MPLLFSYGTLRLPQVQLATFGRLLDGYDDVLPGFELAQLQITDAVVLATSGQAEHPILRPSASADAAVTGRVFELSADELARADVYEVDDYMRIEAVMASGRRAFVYVDRRFAPVTAGP
jgi:hypothetical protein